MKKITLCQGRSCRAFGGKQLEEEIKDNMKDSDDIEICTSGCMGYCATSPNAMVDDALLRDTDVDEIMTRIKKIS